MHQKLFQLLMTFLLLNLRIAEGFSKDFEDRNFVKSTNKKVLTDSVPVRLESEEINMRIIRSNPDIFNSFFEDFLPITTPAGDSQSTFRGRKLIKLKKRSKSAENLNPGDGFLQSEYSDSVSNPQQNVIRSIGESQVDNEEYIEKKTNLSAEKGSNEINEEYEWAIVDQSEELPEEIQHIKVRKQVQEMPPYSSLPVAVQYNQIPDVIESDKPLMQYKIVPVDTPLPDPKVTAPPPPPIVIPPPITSPALTSTSAPITTVKAEATTETTTAAAALTSPAAPTAVVAPTTIAAPTTTVANNNQSLDTDNSTAVLMRVLEELETMKFPSKSDSDLPPLVSEGMPCKLTGSWSSEVAGVRLDMFVNGTGKIRVHVNPRTPPKNGFLNGNWSVVGDAPFTRGQPFLLFATNTETSELATFLGLCKSCAGQNMIIGEWTKVRPAKDCRDTRLIAERYSDYFRKEVLHSLQIEKLSKLQAQKASTVTAAPNVTTSKPTIRATTDWLSV